MHSSTLTSKGQVTIPADLRQALDLHPGDTVAFEPFDNKVLIFKKETTLLKHLGCLK